ncbi:MAG TPA: hypothetical protein VKB49_28640 [Candidatus Sulfotelmatobacter sp.]|nr:hypothetical protein [Candidatus Sulfotelmatobacter sp.]
MSPRLAKCAAASGFVAAILATVVGSSLSPEHSTTALSLITRAVAYITAVFGFAAISTQLVFLVRRAELNARSEDIAIHTATATLWLPPLLVFYGQRSWFALVIFVVFALHVARSIAFLRAVSSGAATRLPESSLEYHAFSLLKRDLPFASSILAAFMIQGAIFAALDNRVALAGLLYLAGTTAVVHRSFKMFRDLPAIGERDSTRSVSAVLIATTFLIVFAWLPYVVEGGRGEGSSLAGGKSGHGQWRQHETETGKGKDMQGSASTLAWLKSLFTSERTGSRGDSFAVAKHMFDSTFPEEAKASDSRPKTGLKTNVAVMMIVGPVFPGVELYPEVQPHTKLVAPAPQTKGGTGTSHTDPLSIPFDGVYWFWRGPSDQPPSNSVLMHGSPSAQFFRSTDGDGMSMEAKQNLGFAVDPRNYGAIEVDIRNADPFPNSVSILLKVRNTALANKPLQSLGMENVVTPGSSEAHAVTQTMRFRLPSKLAMGSFDELTVSYYLRGARSNRSARIAIERFRLVPRG